MTPDCNTPAGSSREGAGGYGALTKHMPMRVVASAVWQVSPFAQVQLRKLASLEDLPRVRRFRRAIRNAFADLEELACECREVVDNARRSTT